MMDRKFKAGERMKGKDLKDCIICAILSEDMVLKGSSKREGTDADAQGFAVEGSCGAGLHFSLIQDICLYLRHGIRLAVISVPEDEEVYMDGDEFCTHRMYLHRVMRLDNPDTWRYLVEHGADMTADDFGAFRWAALNGYLPVMEYLYESGAYEDRAVIWAAMGGRLEAVKYLYEKGVDIEACGNFAFRYAAENGYFEIVEYLHENGADITAEDNYAIRYAAKNGHLEVVKYLHGHGADITAGNNHAVRTAAEKGHLEVVRYLHESGADITALDNDALKRAVNRGHLEIVKYLHENGAEISMCNDCYVFNRAARKQYPEVTEYLKANMA